MSRRCKQRGSGARMRRGYLCWPWIFRQPWLLEHMRGQPALCTTGNRSLGVVLRNVLGQVQVPSLVGQVGERASLRLLGDSTLSLEWTRVCGTLKSGVWVLKALPGLVICLWIQTMLVSSGEKKSGNEKAWATPRHDCLFTVIWAWNSSTTGQSLLG